VLERQLPLLLWHAVLAIVDLDDDVVWVGAIDLAADRLGSAEDLLDGAGERLGHRADAHLTSDLDDLIESNAALVLDVLDLLLITWGLLESANDERRGRWQNVDLGLSVLDGQLDRDAEALPLGGVLGDIFRDLLWGQTEGTDLGGQSGRGSTLTTSNSENYFMNSSWIELWRHSLSN